MTGDGTLLTVRDLKTYFDTDLGLVRAVDGVSFDIRRGEIYALVGESGCGKSVTAYSILRLLPCPPGRIEADRITLDGMDLLHAGGDEMRSVRGRLVSMVFQEPMTSLNPVYTCGNQILEAVELHRGLRGSQARDLGIEMLRKVGIPEPQRRFDEYPHQMSGGMRQRVMIAMALSCNPKLLIADEPTTALDVTIQAQILDLLKDIQADTGLSILLITHDLAVVAETAHRVAVMYASKIVEQSDKPALFEDPRHPYTLGLLASVPELGQETPRLNAIAGSVPNPLAFPPGCKFHPRCPVGKPLPRCRTVEPELREVAPNHWAACWECKGYEQAGDPRRNE